MEESNDGLMSTKGVHNKDTGWVDVTPSSLSSNKSFPSASRWGQYRVYPNGLVQMRGSVQRNSGAWGSSEHVCSIPAHLALAAGAYLHFQTLLFGVQVRDDGGFYSIDTSGQLLNNIYLDGITFSVY